MCFSRVLLGENTNIKWLSVHTSATNLEIINVYGNGLAILGSLVMCTVYTNKFTLVN